MTVDIEEDCKALLPFAKSFYETVNKFFVESEKNYEKYPSGCYIHTTYTGYESLYFNPHKIGKRNLYSRPICKESKKFICAISMF